MSKNSLQRIFWSHIWKSVIIKMFKMSSLKTEAWATRKQLTPSILSLLTFNRKYFKPMFQTRASRLCVDYLKRELMAIKSFTWSQFHNLQKQAGSLSKLFEVSKCPWKLSFALKIFLWLLYSSALFNTRTISHVAIYILIKVKLNI